MSPSRPGNTEPRDFRPLSHPALQILVTLGDSSLHGYGIMQTLEARTGGEEILLPGTLYATMSRLNRQGLVEEVDPPAGESSGGPKRRYYRSTALGRQVARAELERMARLLSAAEGTVLSGETPAG